ncbi:unnamed protein product [Cuscuta epithymum]|uniref:Polygalacturonase n=1 Tax=Cuscuta epithymum TaxID=186058 RepID=A0AAV0FN99_9ASTE|nr:unnamed protein product [Cuscuta epithymum]
MIPMGLRGIILLQSLMMIIIIVSSITGCSVEGRRHFYRKQENDDNKMLQAPSPDEDNTPVSPVPAVVPSDPVEGAPPPDVDDDSGPCVFDVTDYGAVGDGDTDDTAAFVDAWKAACQVEDALLWAPPDLNFMITSTIFSGPCKPGLVFQGPKGSTLRGPCDSPALIRFFMSSNLVVSGLRIQNSPQFHLKFDGCDGVEIYDLSISSPKLSPNTDGIHVQDTTRVRIYDSVIANGDDCISIGSGCSNVEINAVTCGPSHGISIGSLGVHNSQACVSNVTVTNSVIKESDNGLRIKTWQGGTGSVSAVTFDTIQIENVRNCVIIDQYYCLTKDCRNQTSAVYVRDVTYRNIKGTYDVRTPPIHFACSDAVACTGIVMSEVELLPSEGESVADPFCWNAYGVLESLTIPPIDCLLDGTPRSISDAAQYTC